MAKKTGKDLFTSDVPKMPEGYYSGDKPNPNLRAFVEAHVKEHPYDPETDKYDIPAFDKPIETTKATAIYNMHIYWSKKPHDAIREYVRHYTLHNDLVLDPFSGSGGTALAALTEGRKAIAIDLSPSAAFITKNYCTPLDFSEFSDEYEKIKHEVQNEVVSLYETRCDRCGGAAATSSTVYSQVFKCPRCLEKIALFDCEESERILASGKSKKINICPSCHKKGITEEISTQGEKFGFIPVLTSYICKSGCKPVRGERLHNDKNEKKRDYFKKYDLSKLQEIERKAIPYWYPTNRMNNAANGQECWGLLWRRGIHKNISTVDNFFTKRSLWVLATLLDKCRKSTLSQELLFLFQSNILSATIMQQYRAVV